MRKQCTGNLVSFLLPTPTGFKSKKQEVTKVMNEKRRCKFTLHLGKANLFKKKKKDSLLKHFAKERSEVYVNFMMEINC